jgi:hypothetical protein
MIYYVVIHPINGRNDFVNLTELFRKYDIRSAEYHAGGWDDYSTSRIMPHLRFLDEEEATLYALKFGAKILTTVPTLSNQ